MFLKIKIFCYGTSLRRSMINFASFWQRLLKQFPVDQRKIFAPVAKTNNWKNVIKVKVIDSLRDLQQHYKCKEVSAIPLVDGSTISVT